MLKLEEYILKRKKEDRLEEFNLDNRLDFFVTSGSFGEIIKGCNRTWIISFWYGQMGDEKYPEVDEVLFQEDCDRDALLKVDTYIDYINRPSHIEKGDIQKYVLRYRFMEKVIDNYNNLIIIARREYLKLPDGKPFQPKEKVDKNRI